MMIPVLLLALTALLPAGTAQASPLDGKALFAAKGCPACHGADGRKGLAATPHLAGQNAGYMIRQMNEIADGTRNAPAARPMRPVIDKVNADERKAIATWLAVQPPAGPAPPGDAARLEQGAILFDEQGCIGCHGEAGTRPLADYPVLAGQRRDYLAAQIRAIRDEIRSTRRARLMVANVRTLRDDQVERIAEFLSQTKRIQGPVQ
ncbi:c-type cytochrome [Magnetospirillum sp. SS-4]|uniref:c-type cytochrome n=1 Tax=Magnetospirillum sp. SS-4 TaxID=2681465 RepID=UPI00138347CB|nr:c-type cytochrome [Magnetospirillum sp. SS-4]CAA7621281.1 Cytochrome C4 [Magnetospirillum sp. SS-4]